MKKKLTIIMIMFVLILSACGGSGSSSNTKGSATKSNEVVQPTAAASNSDTSVEVSTSTTQEAVSEVPEGSVELSVSNSNLTAQQFNSLLLIDALEPVKDFSVINLLEKKLLFSASIDLKNLVNSDFGTFTVQDVITKNLGSDQSFKTYRGKNISPSTVVGDTIVLEQSNLPAAFWPFFQVLDPSDGNSIYLNNNKVSSKTETFSNKTAQIDTYKVFASSFMPNVALEIDEESSTFTVKGLDNLNYSISLLSRVNDCEFILRYERPSQVDVAGESFQDVIGNDLSGFVSAFSNLFSSSSSSDIVTGSETMTSSNFLDLSTTTTGQTTSLEIKNCSINGMLSNGDTFVAEIPNQTVLLDSSTDQKIISSGYLKINNKEIKADCSNQIKNLKVDIFKNYDVQISTEDDMPLSSCTSPSTES